MVKVRFLVFLFVSFRSREALCRAERDVVVPFRLRLKMKREQQKTPNDARRVEGRRDGKKSTARRREESERIFRRHFFAREEKATTKRALGTRARKRRAAFGSGFPAFSGPLVSGADLFLLSLSLSLLHRRALQKHTDWENQNHAPAAEGNREIRVLHPRLVGLRRRLIRRVVVHLGANAPV